MQSFIEEVVSEILQKEDNIENCVFILPSKRAGAFLRDAIAKKNKRTRFAPIIYSIESFIENVSGLTYATNTQLLFNLYSTYLNYSQGEKDDFYVFSKWGQTLLQDFNEIDRHLIEPKDIFSNLAAVLELNHWSLQPEKTKMMEDYLHFWNNLELLYNNFSKTLLNQNLGHQGLVYRTAGNTIKTYTARNTKNHYFIGFNALNKAEVQIIQQLLDNGKTEIYWDIDISFLKDPVHDASYFIRKYVKQWPHFSNANLKGTSNFYTSSKKIQVIGVPKNVSQAKYAGTLIEKLYADQPDSLKNTALVLGDETLLNPILHSIPKEIDAVNITMGYPLSKAPLADLFEQFLTLYINKDEQGWYYKNVMEFLSHPFITILLEDSNGNISIRINETIKKKNLTYLNSDKICSLGESNQSTLSLLFFKEQLTSEKFVERCIKIIAQIKDQLQDSTDSMVLEYLYRFHKLFNQVLDLVRKHPFISDIKSLLSLYKELLSSETLDFQGDPLEGLQIMGMLESRNLDFETVILTSVNEGILPSGKSNNSFIPFDLKTYFNLPTYKEKDAVYTYHFYRLLQRAKNIYILYNTEPDVLEGGEKSRLITQLLTDEAKIADITEIIAAPKIKPISKKLEVISKDPSLLQLIKKHAANGFSPSSLSNYIRNPLDFYKQNLLGIEDTLAVEENVAANTFGTIVHDSLEDLYKPLVGKFLTQEHLKAMKPKIKGLVAHHFEKSYHDGNIKRGKNLIAFNVIIKYLENFIASEISEVKKHQIKVLGLEEKLKIELNFETLDSPVFLKGKLDRIDEKDGVLRVIDYKTGKVDAKNVTITNWDNIISEYEYSKAFQLLCYALMYETKTQINTLEAGIITFKNLSAGLLKFTLKEGKIKDSIINKDILEKFSEQLKKLVLEILNPKIPFTEKEV